MRATLRGNENDPFGRQDDSPYALPGMNAPLGNVPMTMNPAPSPDITGGDSTSTPESRDRVTPREQQPNLPAQPSGPQLRQPQAAPAQASTERSSEPSPNASSAPGRPMAPTPMSTQPPIPFNPLPSTDAASTSATTDFPTAPAPALRNPSLYGTSNNSLLFGKAGGLLGGGMGAAGTLGQTGTPQEADITSLIQALLRQANG